MKFVLLCVVQPQGLWVGVTSGTAVRGPPGRVPGNGGSYSNSKSCAAYTTHRLDDAHAPSGVTTVTGSCTRNTLNQYMNQGTQHRVLVKTRLLIYTKTTNPLPFPATLNPLHHSSNTRTVSTSYLHTRLLLARRPIYMHQTVHRILTVIIAKYYPNTIPYIIK